MKIHVIGAGGVGFWFVVSLTKTIGSKLITVYDDDDLTGGLGHTRLPSASLTTKKVDLLRGHLLVAYGISPPTMVPQKFKGDEVSSGDLVVDCSDMQVDVRREIWKLARERGARCIRVSYDGKNGTVVVAEGLPLFGSKKGGYSETPLIDLSFAAGGIGAFVVRRILEDKVGDHVEFQISIDELAGIKEEVKELTIPTAVAVNPEPKPARKRSNKSKRPRRSIISTL